MNWEKRFEALGACWVHDGNPNRPYAKLTSGMISNGFFNAGLIMSEHPMVFAEGVEELARRGRVPHTGPLRLIGAAEGAITLAYQLAVSTDNTYAYARKDEAGSLVFDARFAQYFQTHERFLVCEDTITTGRTIEKLMNAAQVIVPRCSFAPLLLALCNRSGLERIGGCTIVALVNRPMRTWEEGENPFTPDGTERVPPVRPKTHWGELMRGYA